MNEMTNLQKMDYACIHTWHKYGKKQVIGALLEAIQNGNYQLFTSANQARAIAREVTPIYMKLELLKNLVKSMAYKENTNDYEYTDTSLLDFSNSVKNVPLNQIEKGLLNIIEGPTTRDMESGQVGFEYLDDPNLLQCMIESFVHTRYERQLMHQIDGETFSNPQVIDDMIAFAMRYQNGYTNRSR